MENLTQKIPLHLLKAKNAINVFIFHQFGPPTSIFIFHFFALVLSRDIVVHSK